MLLKKTKNHQKFFSKQNYWSNELLQAIIIKTKVIKKKPPWIITDMESVKKLKVVNRWNTHSIYDEKNFCFTEFWNELNWRIFSIFYLKLRLLYSPHSSSCEGGAFGLSSSWETTKLKVIILNSSKSLLCF